MYVCSYVCIFVCLYVCMIVSVYVHVNVMKCNVMYVDTYIHSVMWCWDSCVLMIHLFGVEYSKGFWTRFSWYLFWSSKNQLLINKLYRELWLSGLQKKRSMYFFFPAAFSSDVVFDNVQIILSNITRYLTMLNHPRVYF